MSDVHEADQTLSNEAEHQRLLTIGMFASAVGLSTSALRLYDQTGLIAPAAVEERTGYRYYGRDQQQRAIWVRRLRDAGLRLDRIRAVLESDGANAEAVLDDWLTEAEERSASIEAIVDDVKSSLRARLSRNPAPRTTARLDAAVLSSALRQLGMVEETRCDTTGIDGVLVEVASDSLRLVATDRYLLLARMNVPAIVSGPPARVHLSTPAVDGWLRERPEVKLVIESPVGRDAQRRVVRAWFRDASLGELALPQGPDRFPDARQIIDAIGPATGRAVFSRRDVLRLAAENDARSILLAFEKGEAHLTIDDHVVSGQSTGAFSSVEVSKSALLRMAEAAVGDELTCEGAGPGQPLAWRAPGQPDFVALMMPRRA